MKKNLQLHESLASIPPFDLVFASGDTEKEFVIDVQGVMKRIILSMPSFSGAVVTGAVSITNSSGIVIYEKTGMAEDDDHVRLTDELLIGENTVKVTLSEDPLSDGTCQVSLDLEGN